MKLRKLICIGLSLAMLASAAGCAGGTEPAASSNAPAAGAEAAGAAGTEDAGIEAAGAAGVEDAGNEAAVAEAAGAEAAGTAEAAATEGAAAAGEAAAGEIPPEDVSVTWEDSRVYDELTLGRYAVIPTYGVKGYEDVPFISVNDYLRLLYKGAERAAVEDGSMKIRVNGTEVVIDPSEDTIYIENAARLRSAGDVDGPVVDDEAFNTVTWSVKNESSQTEAAPLTVSLHEYDMPVIPYGDTVLMPFLALQNVFGGFTCQSRLAYNGRDYFNAFQAQEFITGKEDLEEQEKVKKTPYLKAFYSGPFSEKKQTTQAYADYGYNSICLLLDLTFGHREEKDITTFDEYFTRLNAKESLRSTDPSAAATAEFLLFHYLFDSGHDALIGTDTVFGRIKAPGKDDVAGIVDEIRQSDEGGELFEDAQAAEEGGGEIQADVILGALIERGFKIPDAASIIAWDLYFGKARPEGLESQRLDYAGDTAVIYFNAFKDDVLTRNPSYYLDPVKKEDEEASTFAFFYNCFEDIKKHDEVKNVVLNLSDNGGGAVTALISVLGFLSEDGEARLTLRDLPAGSYKEEWYHVDTNLDGVADDRDGYGGQYDFYIMCSSASYSCGNALPYFAQKEGLAKIIGTKPGGGDCVVANFVDAYGRCAVYSGFLKLGTEEDGTFVSDEEATEVDLNMMPSILDINSVPWFDPEGIADAVHQYQDGATELTYGDATTEEKISGLLMDFLEEIGKIEEAQEADAAGGAAGEAAEEAATGEAEAEAAGEPAAEAAQ